jgi:curved DNA-binding protein
MDYYNVLGISRDASQDDIKAAYRKLAMKHHPDRGGDPKKFQEIQEAYATLGDENKRRDHDNPNPFGHGGQGHPFGQGNPFGEDVFTHFFTNNPFGGFGFHHQQTPRNTNITAVVDITLEDVLKGKTIEAQLSFRNGDQKIVSITIPPGVEDGIQIRYPNMGDHSQPKYPPGDLIVTVRVMPHPKWQRDGMNLIWETMISAWDAILGTAITVDTLDGKQFTINVPAGTQPDTVLSCKGEGVPHPRGVDRGNLLIKIKISIPRNITNEQKNLVQLLKNGI